MMTLISPLLQDILIRSFNLYIGILTSSNDLGLEFDNFLKGEKSQLY
jgi:hypothetical protein